ncbi:hypothetical protein FKG94_28395, partial [Exilibacterium tricleocarpae]
MMQVMFRKQMNRTMTSILRPLLLLMASLFVADLYGDEGVYELDLKNRFITQASANYALSPHSPDLMGENFDLTTGAIRFERIDGDLPGNSALEVAYRTSFAIQTPHYRGWKEELPRIELDYLTRPGFDSRPNGWATGNYCSGTQKPKSIRAKYFNILFDRDEYTTISSEYYTPGPKLIVPGKTDGKLLYNSSPANLGLDQAAYRFVTKDKWRLSCYTSGAAEGFKATSPEGITYFFDVYHQQSLNENDVRALDTGYSKRRALLLASRVEDRFGNDVNYYYTSSGLLRLIVANDGRRITITHSGAVKTMTSNGRVWTYTRSTVNDRKNLVVERPDGRQWHYDLFQSKSRRDPEAGECDGTETFSPTMTVTHPDGTVGTFDFDLIENGRVNVERIYIVSPYHGTARAPIGRCFLSYSLVRKTLRGAGFSNQVWHYAYSEKDGFYGTDTSPHNSFIDLPLPVPANVNPRNSKTITIAQPDASSVKYYINRNVLSPLENKIEAKEYYDTTGALLKQVRHYYKEGNKFGNPVSRNRSNRDLDVQIPKLTKVEIDQAGDTYTTEYLNFDLYDVAQEKSEYNSYSTDRRYSQWAFYNDSTHWLLTLPGISKVGTSPSDLITFREDTYHAPTSSYKSLPHEVRIMGIWQTRAGEYHPDGNLRKMVYNGTSRYEVFDNYKLGRAQKITLPCATTNGCSTANDSTTNTIRTLLSINDHGWLQSTTDFKGNGVNYEYDAMGRLTKIDPVESSVADTTISYETVATAGDGISGSGVVPGMFKQTIRRGNYEKRLYHDTLLRPVFTREMDISDAATARYSRAVFDHLNRPTFTAFASESVAAAAGTETVYDGLGRQKTVTRNTDNAVTAFSYLANNRVQVTDPNLNITTTQYLAYGAPATASALNISAPEGVTTNIRYNPLNQVVSITQGGITEHRYYDHLQQLCKVHRPETGNTAYAYNARRQLAWFAEGAAGSTTGCDTGSVEAAKKVAFTYNNLGERSAILYPDSTADVSYGYDENGNLTRLTAGDVSHVYSYNNQDLLVNEALRITESGYTKTLELGYGYNSLQHQIYQSYPNGKVIEFSVNALGQAESAQSYLGTAIDKRYATNARYHANGLLSGFTFGNGVTHTATQTVNRLPERIRDQLGSGTKMMDLQYGYDQNQNVTSLINHRDSAFSLSNLSYDGLDRLTSTTGGSGIGSSAISYDPLGNIQTYSSKGANLTYTYDTAKNRLTGVLGTGSQARSYAYFSYDDRGNVTHNSHRPFSFNHANQLVDSGTNTYRYDGHNRRVKQTDSRGISYSMYSQAGRLLYRETGVNGTTGEGDGVNYIFLGPKLIAKEGVFRETGSSLQHYKPFGETLSAPTDEIGYTGHKFDADLGLSYMQARYYDPVIGRFY